MMVAGSYKEFQCAAERRWNSTMPLARETFKG